MAARKAAFWFTVGAAGAGALLTASPGAYAWVRRIARLEDDRRFYEDDEAGDGAVDAAPEVHDPPLDDVRLSLRARLHDVAVPIGTPVATPVEAAAPAGDDVDAARARLRARAATAADAFTAEDDDTAEFDAPAPG